MKVFQKIREILASLGFTPNHQQNNHRLLNLRQIFYIVKYSMDIAPLAAYIFLKANGIEQYMDPIFSFTIEFGIEMTFINIIFKSDKLFNMIEAIEVELNFRSNNNPVSRKIHEETNQLIEKLSKIIYFVAMNLGAPGFVVPKAIISYFIYFSTDAGSAAFDPPFPACYPFDWENPIGFLIVIIWQFAATFLLLRFLACLLLLALASLLFAFSITKDWKNDLRTLDAMAKTKRSETDMFEQLTEFVRSHSNIEHMVNNFVDVYQVCIFADFLCCTITLCVVMMMIQVEILVQYICFCISMLIIMSKDIIDPVMVWKSTFYGGWVFCLVFVSCEIGQRFTNLFEDIDDRFDQLNWYSFPMKVQRLLPTIMINAQEPIVVGCFGIVVGSRVQFQKVVNIVYKTFNVLREVYN